MQCFKRLCGFNLHLSCSASVFSTCWWGIVKIIENRLNFTLWWRHSPSCWRHRDFNKNNKQTSFWLTGHRTCLPKLPPPSLSSRQGTLKFHVLSHSMCFVQFTFWYQSPHSLCSCLFPCSLSSCSYCRSYCLFSTHTRTQYHLWSITVNCRNREMILRMSCRVQMWLLSQSHS